MRTAFHAPTTYALLHLFSNNSYPNAFQPISNQNPLTFQGIFFSAMHAVDHRLCSCKIEILLLSLTFKAGHTLIPLRLPAFVQLYFRLKTISPTIPLTPDQSAIYQHHHRILFSPLLTYSAEAHTPISPHYCLSK